ncbi:DUF4190 domain-containing protein [Candidatus Sumerlaeota bacterium]|nr:DUF4190 domain-containing protein [Candidatus Sumerlaeota bacterium]
MFCPRCGHENPDAIFRCMSCGADLSPSSPAPYAPVPGKTSSIAVFSLVLGVMSIVCFGVLAGIPALILGVIAISEIRRSQGALSGLGMAIAGMILGICSLLISLLIFLVIYKVNLSGFFDPDVRSKVSRVKADQRSMATGLEAYFVDNSCYPAWALEGESVNSAGFADSDSYSLPSFKIWSQPLRQMDFSTLTTPVAYITRYFNDPFSRNPDVTYVYYSDINGWILISPGPDEVYDIDPLEDYISTNAQPSGALLEKCYDPTNGIKSGGDIFRVKM